MSYGIRLLNDSGAILVDGEYSNYSLLASGTLAVSPGGTDVTFAATPARPIVFVRLQSTTKWAAIGFLSSTVARFHMYDSPSLPDINPRNEVSGTLEYMIFGLALAVAPVAGYGMRVYNAVGLLMYDSSVLTPRVKQIVQVSSIPSPQGGVNLGPVVSVSHSLGGSPWIMANPTLCFYGHYYQTGSTADLFRPCVRSSAAGQIEVSVGKVVAIGTTDTRWPVAPLVFPLIA